jgi:HEAT repeat protein
LDEVIDAPMYHEPELPAARVVVVYQDAKELWLRALQRPEAELRCQAADAIALAGRRRVKGIETIVPALLHALDQPDQHPAGRLSVAKALITLDARESAPSLLRQAESGGSDLRDLIEPALARWKYEPARTPWRARIRDPAAPPRSCVLAIRGLAALGESQAVDRLRELVLAERVPGMVRLEAARAVASLRDEGLEEDAERLSADTSARGTVARLAAAALLRRHHGDKAVRLLQGLTRDPEPAVAELAIARLIELGPELVPAPDQLLASRDANVRSLVVEVLFRRPSQGNIRLLGDRLDDVHPAVRLKARRALHELAGRKDLRNPVIAAATQGLAEPSWRGQEQAAMLLVHLDHKPATTRLLELLASRRPEVAVAVAWGIRKLSVPETMPAVLAHVDTTLARVDRELRIAPPPAATAQAGRPPSGRGDFTGVPRAAPAELPQWAIDHQLSQLNQFLGQRKYVPAEAVLRRFIPRHLIPQDSGRRGDALAESRAAAIWALGLIDKGKPIPALVTALDERLNDHPPPPALPEVYQVQWMSAITLGRLQAKQALPSLRQYCTTQAASGEHFHDACGWAIEQLTGEALRPPKTIERVQRDGFLTPE